MFQSIEIDNHIASNPITSMKECLFCLSFFFLTFLTMGQEKTMAINRNSIDYEFKASEKLNTAFDNLDSREEISIIAKKWNDTLASIYIRNNTKDTLGLSLQDSEVFLIQEAKNPNGEWKPVEFWRFAWCGNSYIGRNLTPGEIIKTESTFHKGKFNTQIRFKVLNNNKVYFSNALAGTVELFQFEIPESIYKDYGGKTVAEKVIFLEPDGMKEYGKNVKIYNEELAKKRKQHHK